MKYKFNGFAIFSIMMLGIFYSSLWDMVGTIPEIQTEPDTWKDAILVGLTLLAIWFVGFMSKFGYDKNSK